MLDDEDKIYVYFQTQFWIMVATRLGIHCPHNFSYLHMVGSSSVLPS